MEGRSKGLMALLALLVAVAAAAVVAPTTAAASCGEPGAHDAEPFGTTACPGVRPGALMMQSPPPFEGGCTFGFMFRGGGSKFIATAGHCAGVRSGDEKRWAAGDGPEVLDESRRRIGEFAYAVVGDELHATDFDFALIRLDEGVKASPEVCHFGGPTGINADIVPVTAPVTIHYYGQTYLGGRALVGGEPLVPARTGIATGLPNPARAYFYGHVWFGDSGAPVLTKDGRAVGVLGGPGEADSSGHAGLVSVPRLGPQIKRASAYLGHNLKLILAPTRR